MKIVEFKGQKNNTIRFILGDNIEWMNEIDWKWYHLGIVDPPYGIDVTKMNLGKTKKQLKEIKHERGTWDSETPKELYWEKLFYVTRNQIVWGANYFGEFLGNCQKFYLWDKEQPEGLSFADCEFAWTSFEGAPKMIKRSRQKDVKHEKIHDTQKPVYLYDAIFKDLFDREILSLGQRPRILDTHGGSHNIVIAAWRYHLSIDVVELQEQHHLSGIDNFVKKCTQQRIDFF